ncbi:MAG: DUF692 family protein [Sandaracinaceae bacterium]|nr:DUF692 family protein [Sandaracinaceae bacterium]
MEPTAIGLALREPWIEELSRLPDRGGFEVLEIMVDDYLCAARRPRELRQLGARWVLVAHGVDLGIGDAAGPDPAYLGDVHETLRQLHVRWWSDHLAFLRAGGVDLGHFAPLDGEPDTLATLRGNARRAQTGAPCPLLLENPADVLGLGVTDAASAEVLGARYRDALRAAEVGALLDLTNLLYDARNGGFDPLRYLDALDLDRVVEVHLAGGREAFGLWIDSHDRPVEAEALGLLARVAERAPSLRAVIVEWDEDLPSFEGALAEVARVHDVLRAAGRR